MGPYGFGPLRRSGLFHARRTTIALAATGALTISGLAAVAPATSAPDPACPGAHTGPLSGGLPVHGLTVRQGTTPEPFTGELLGVLDDGIAPGLDMVVARLTSPEIDRVGGIWAGMSGSPVYAADGSLIGAVSYGLAWGPSPVAGITPAEDMQALLSTAPADATARRALRAAAGSDNVALPRAVQRDIVASGAAAATEVDGGLSRLPLPLGISGMSTTKRLSFAAKKLGLDDVRVHKAAAVAAQGPASEMVAGGNLAASLSYGDVSSVGVGTATAVCGNEVLAFGHPMAWTGPSTLSMHGADALYIQEDSLGAPFKVANATEPVGTITQDRMAGLLGRTGALPATTDVTSRVSVVGEGARDGATYISVPAAVPDIASFHLLANQDRVFDGITGGSSQVSWTVRGTRANGKTFSFTRHDRYADQYDASFPPVFDLYDQLWQVQNNSTARVELTRIHERSTMSRAYAAFSVKKVQVRNGRAWVKLRTDRVLRVRAGAVKRFRVTLGSAALGTRMIGLSLRVPRAAAGKFGYLEILGGNSYYPDGEEGGSAPSLDVLLRQLQRAPRNDHVLANLHLFRDNGSVLRRSTRKQAAAVVDGGVSVEVRGLRMKRK